MKILRIFLLSLLLISITYAEETGYSYKLELDTTITGNVVADGHIFRECETTLVVIHNPNKRKDILPHIEFLDENYKTIKTITLLHKNDKIYEEPLIADFDNDGFEEVVFTIREPGKARFLYFDPSNTPEIEEIFFEINIDLFPTIHVTLAQLDDDKLKEVIIYYHPSHKSLPKIFKVYAINPIEKKVFWKRFGVEDHRNNPPINIVNKEDSYLLFAGSSTIEENKKRTAVFSNGNYFIINEETNTKKTYNLDLKKIPNVKIDRSAEDYSVDTLASIRAIDSKNKLTWEKIVGGRYTETRFDTITIKNEKKILLAVFSLIPGIRKSTIEIINPQSGITEKKIEIKDEIAGIFVVNNKIYIPLLLKNTLIKLASDLSYIVENSSINVPRYGVFQDIEVGRAKLLLAQTDTGYDKKLTILDDKLNVLGKEARHYQSFYILKKSKIISLSRPFYLGNSKLYTIKKIPWYDKLTISEIRIAFFVSLLIVALFWIISLGASSKKIKKQNVKLEKIHDELRNTTSKLIYAEKLAVYGTIASSIAHEINTPLGAIINSVQRIRNDKTTNIEQNLNLIEKAGKRAKIIIEKLLIGVAQSKDEEPRANLSDVLKEWLELSGKQLENLGIKLKSTLDCEQCLAISPTELNQILTNLFFNARDSIVEKKGAIKEITIESKEVDDSCSISIKDTGTGFSDEKLENPFKAFETYKEHGKGTGLGLWVIKRIITNVGGRITIENYDKGAEIKMIIPLYIEE